MKNNIISVILVVVGIMFLAVNVYASEQAAQDNSIK